MNSFNNIDFSGVERSSLRFSSSEDINVKKWSYFNVYSLEALRDIYILLFHYGFKNLHVFSSKIYDSIQKWRSSGIWNERNVLEYLNALKDLNLVDNDYNRIGNFTFKDDRLGEPLNDMDKAIYRKLYFSYPRFSEFMKLYSLSSEISENIMLHDSHCVYSFVSDKKYTDCFFMSLKNPHILYIPEENEKKIKNGPVVRFWDVFMSWGLKLDVIEKMNSSSFNYYINKNKTFTCSYFLSSKDSHLPPLLQILNEIFSGKTILGTIDLVFYICTTYRKRISEVKEYIIDEYLSHKDVLGLIRTSEIFIKKGEITSLNEVLFPLYKNSFISHITLRP